MAPLRIATTVGSKFHNTFSLDVLYDIVKSFSTFLLDNLWLHLGLLQLGVSCIIHLSRDSLCDIDNPPLHYPLDCLWLHSGSGFLLLGVSSPNTLSLHIFI